MDKFQLALITGASGGIGESLARLLASKKINLIICGRHQERLELLKNELSQLVQVQVFSMDLEKKEARKELTKIIEERVPDLVVNNAGFGLYGDATVIDLEQQMNILELNISALTELSIVSGRALIKAGKKGVIHNVSSAGAFITFPSFALYSSSKAYVNHFSRSFDFEMKPYGIRVLASCPGIVLTKFRFRATLGQPFEKRSESKETLGVMSPEFAANEIWWQIVHEKPIHIFSWKYRWAIRLSRFLPDCWITPGIRKKVHTYCPPGHLLDKQ